MRNFYKTSLIVTLAGVLFLNEGAAFAFEFKNPFKRNRAKVEKKKTEEPVQNTEEKLEPSVYLHDKDNTSSDDIEAVHIKDVEIYGNNLIETSFIKGQLSLKEGYPFNRKTVANDLNKLYKSGYFTQNIRALPIKLDDGNVKLRIIVEENPPIEGFLIEGNNCLSTYEIMDVLKNLEGKPQNILAINAAIENIQELYAGKGYILAKVTSIQDDPDNIITVKIDEGVIGDIKVEGNNKTKDFIVKRNILQTPGEVYNENLMRADIMRLMGTQAFKDVQRDIQLNEETGAYDVIVKLDEQRTGRVSLGVGIDSNSGFFGSVGFGENNFLGLGQKLNLNVMAGTGILMHDSSVVNRANLQAELSFLEPHFKSENQSLGFRAFARNFGSYQVPLAIEERYGGDITLTRAFEKSRNLSMSMSLGAENVHLKEGDRAEIMKLYASHGISPSRRHEQLEGGFYARAIPSLIYDTRDNIINTRRGVIAKVSLEEALSFSDADSYGKLNGVLKKFIPAGRKSSLVLTARAGGKINGHLPEFAAYTLGGPYSLRGFNVADVGSGNGFMMGSAEFRFPIPFLDRITSNSFLNNIRLAGFVDAGKVFGSTLTDRLYDRPGYGITAGAGVRIFIPGLGSINLDYGIPLTNTKGSGHKNGFFTFGMGDML
ncbi:MAG: BamA/TamA family outer membrane protein [Candidatus Gastranaerophilales bacterium]|nr:BamA/TamA family outer membrane protein [Candidatus Gastranaerophilales bacterium]